MGDGFHVGPDAIIKYAVKAEQHHDDIPRVASALAHVSVPAGAFGKLPDAGELHSAYREYASAAEYDVHDLAGVLKDVADGLRQTAGDYLRNEHALRQGLNGIVGGL